MADDEFWQLIDLLEGRTDEDALARLTEALHARGRRSAVAFQERLARVLYDLDREELADQPVRYADDPADQDPLPLSDDGFLYLRAGIVARGRETYQAVLADPAVLASGTWDECEDLLYVAEEVTGDDIETKVSYETGSNERHWTPRAEPDEPAGPRLVYVDGRDLSDPIEGMTYHADGSTEPDVTYLAPEHVPDRLWTDLTETFSQVVAGAGGLPPELDALQVQVFVEFGEEWDTAPRVSEPMEDPELGVPRVRQVRVGVDDADAQAWSGPVRHEVLSALAAACLLAVLPEGHAARTELEQLRAAGAPHLPSS
jgi:hypothetical protein